MENTYNNTSTEIQRCLGLPHGLKVWHKCFIWVDFKLVKESRDVRFLKQFLNSL